MLHVTFTSLLMNAKSNDKQCRTTDLTTLWQRSFGSDLIKLNWIKMYFTFLL